MLYTKKRNASSTINECVSENLKSCEEYGAKLTLMAEVPIIATRFRSIPELITHMHSGYLVTPGDVDELSEAIVKLALDKDLRCLLAKNAKLVAQDFSVERVIPKLATELGIRL